MTGPACPLPELADDVTVQPDVNRLHPAVSHDVVWPLAGEGFWNCAELARPAESEEPLC